MQTSQVLKISNSQDNSSNNKRQHEGDGDEQHAKRNRFDYDYDSLIKVTVGTPETSVQQFRVHQDSICEKSSFFKAAVTDERWPEGQKKRVMLPAFSPRTFRAYAHWVYTGKVLPEVFWQTPSTEICAFNEQVAYVDLYLLAEFLDDTQIRVEIVEAMISKMTSWDSVPGWSVCATVWEQTPKGSPLRSVILESKIRCQSHLNFAGHVEDYEKEFLGELATLLMQRSDSSGEVETLEQLSARMRAQLLSLPVRDHPDIMG